MKELITALKLGTYSPTQLDEWEAIVKEEKRLLHEAIEEAKRNKLEAEAYKELIEQEREAHEKQKSIEMFGEICYFVGFITLLVLLM